MRSSMSGSRWLFLLAGLAWSLTVCAQSGSSEETAGDASSSTAEEAAPDSEKADKPPVSRPMISTGQDDQTLAASRPDLAVWLETDAGGRTLGLLELERDTPRRGAIVILANEGQSADTALTGALRAPLAERGWATMTLGLPAPPYPLIRARHERANTPSVAERASPQPSELAANEPNEAATPESAEAEANADSIMIDVLDSSDLDQLRKDYRDARMAQLDAAISHLRGLGYERVALVGVGRGASMVASRSLTGSGAGVGEPQMLVWVTPVLSDADIEAVSGARAQALRVLDLRSSLAESGAMAQQKAVVRRAGFAGYQQQSVAIDLRPKPRDAELVASRIGAWLKRTLNPEPD